jgi:hypothetical protein
MTLRIAARRQQRKQRLSLRGELVGVSVGQSTQPGAGARCSATTKRGNPCRAAAVSGSQFCGLHGDPARAAELGRLGGRKNRHYVETDEVTIAPPSTPEDVKNLLAQAMADVRARKLDPRIASTLTYMSGAFLKAFETTEMEQRLTRLEKELQQKKEEKP